MIMTIEKRTLVGFIQVQTFYW